MEKSKNKHKHLTAYERGMIKILHEQGNTPYAIAKVLGRASNTIRNELKRGTVHQYDSRRNKDRYIYFPEAGYGRYKKNRCKSVHHYKKDRNQKIKEFIHKVEKNVLENGYSLDSSLHLVIESGTYEKENIVCVRTLYNYVEQGVLKVKNIDLPYKVGRRVKREKPPMKRQHGKSIDMRKEEIQDRMEFGHWEIDLVLGEKTKTDDVLLTMTERKTRKNIIRKLKAKQVEFVNECVRDMVKTLPKGAIKTITSDNGSEFAGLCEIEEEHDIDVYYAHPYSSYERGSNENANRLVRRHAKKGKPIALLSDEKVQYIEDWMNQMPRRLLEYRSSESLYQEELERLIT
ncbi:MAG: IS30 family transposase [Lachnospiraceae bacterium]|nr:IS30 family transposase [Lachnospiraceae bacterium]